MTRFYVVHDNTQGVVMRVFNAISRRAIEFSSFCQTSHADGDTNCTLSLQLDATDKQHGQLLRDWLDIVGVLTVEIYDEQGRPVSTHFPR